MQTCHLSHSLLLAALHMVGFVPVRWGKGERGCLCSFVFILGDQGCTHSPFESGEFSRLDSKDLESQPPVDLIRKLINEMISSIH